MAPSQRCSGDGTEALKQKKLSSPGALTQIKWEEQRVTESWVRHVLELRLAHLCTVSLPGPSITVRT